jgi:hypothetical protein
MHYTFPGVELPQLARAIVTNTVPSARCGTHNIGISVEIVDAICSGTCCILARGGASVLWVVQEDP